MGVDFCCMFFTQYFIIVFILCALIGCMHYRENTDLENYNLHFSKRIFVQIILHHVKF